MTHTRGEPYADCIPLEGVLGDRWVYNPNSPSVQEVPEGELGLDDAIKPVAATIKENNCQTGTLRDARPSPVTQGEPAWCQACNRTVPTPCVACAARAYRARRGRRLC